MQVIPAIDCHHGEKTVSSDVQIIKNKQKKPQQPITRDVVGVLPAACQRSRASIRCEGGEEGIGCGFCVEASFYLIDTNFSPSSPLNRERCLCVKRAQHLGGRAFWIELELPTAEVVVGGGGGIYKGKRLSSTVIIIES